MLESREREIRWELDVAALSEGCDAVRVRLGGVASEAVFGSVRSLSGKSGK
jgi:hypothetical protein